MSAVDSPVPALAIRAQQRAPAAAPGVAARARGNMPCRSVRGVACHVG